MLWFRNKVLNWQTTWDTVYYNFHVSRVNWNDIYWSVFSKIPSIFSFILCDNVVFHPVIPLHGWYDEIAHRRRGIFGDYRHIINEYEGIPSVHILHVGLWHFLASDIMLSLKDTFVQLLDVSVVIYMSTDCSQINAVREITKYSTIYLLSRFRLSSPDWSAHAFIWKGCWTTSYRSTSASVNILSAFVENTSNYEFPLHQPYGSINIDWKVVVIAYPLLMRHFRVWIKQILEWRD